jgi:hypothetical protein
MIPRHLHTALLIFATPVAAGTSLTPASGPAWGANIGWIDPQAGDGTNGAVLGACVCKGFLYSANCGWINLGDGTPANGAQYTNTSGSDSGVNRLPDGRLRGLAWGASIGWINFEDTGNPRLDPATGELTGKAWSAGCGWICFDTPPGGIYTVVTDTDHDGLPDEWEYSYAASLTTLTANGDSDGDGQSDAAEYAAGTDPADAGSLLRITAFTPGVSTASLTWTSSPNRNYRVQVSSDLTNWTWDNFAVIFPANPLISAGAAGTTTTRTVLKPAGPRQFFRVIALKPPAAP